MSYWKGWDSPQYCVLLVRLGQPSVLCLIGKAGTALSIVSYWKGWDSPQYCVLLERLGQPSVLCLSGKAGTQPAFPDSRMNGRLPENTTYLHDQDIRHPIDH